MSDRYADHRQMVTDAMIEALEKGTAPWQRDWSTEGGLAHPINATTGEPYSGGNAMWLLMAQLTLAPNDNRFVTFNQAAHMRDGTNERLTDKEFELNKKLRFDDPNRIPTWRVRKGVHGFPIEKWIIKDADDESGAAPATKRGGDALPRRRAFVRHYTVFHATQVDGMPALPKREVTWDPIESVERIVRGSGVRVIEGGVKAAYSPSKDEIYMPDRDRFPTAEAFYAVQLHECGHSTGHATRWPPDVAGRSPESFVKREFGMFGDELYAREELFVEIASMYACADLGLTYDTSRHASYVASWIKHLRSNPNALFEACRGAQDIADVLHGYQIKLELTLESERIEQDAQLRRIAAAPPRIERIVEQPALGLAL